MKKVNSVLITGIAGLLGSRMSEWIHTTFPEIKIVGIDDLSGGYIQNVGKFVEFHQIDACSSDLKELFQVHNFDIVYHFSAYAAEGLSPFIRKFNYNNNLIATANIVNFCIEFSVSRLVFTSSMAVYGQGNPPFAESDLPNPIDPYGVAKYACEMDIQIAGEQHGLDWCIIRPHNVYGLNQNIWDKYRNVLGIWMYQVLNNEPMTIFGDGEQKRAFSFIDDCLEPLWNAAVRNNASKQIINLGGVEAYTINQAAETLKNVIGYGEIIYLEGRHEVKDAHPTFEKSIHILDYKESTNLKEGLRIMWEWAKIQPMRERFKWDQYELNKGIYSFWK